MAHQLASDRTTDELEQAELHKYLTFVLGSVYYGLDIQYVREIIGMQDITVVPDVPGFIKG